MDKNESKNKRLIILGLVGIICAIILCLYFLVTTFLKDRNDNNEGISINEKLVTDLKDGIIMSTSDVDYK